MASLTERDIAALQGSWAQVAFEADGGSDALDMPGAAGALTTYELAGDHFVLIAGDAGAPRPTAFRTEPGQTMRTFVRRR